MFDIMKTKIITKQIFFWLIAATLLTASCTKNPVENPLIRLFKPVVATDPAIQGNQITLSWLKIKGAVSYTVMLSRDTTFQTVDKTTNIGMDTTNVVFSNLLWDQSYRIRLKANGSDPTFNSKFVELDVKTAKFPTILVAATSNDLTDYSVVVRWTNTGAAATSINVTKTDGTLLKTVVLTAADLAAGYREIQGLSGTTMYGITIFSGTVLRGTQNYTTIASPNFGTANIIDLRSITGRPTVLTDTMANAVSGSVYILRRSETYTCNTATFILSKSIKVICLPGLGNPAQLNYLNETDISGAIDSIKFKDVSITGLKSDGTSKVAYMFNTTGTYNCNVGILSFENCTVRSFGNAIVRLQTGAAPWGIINKVYVNNCILNDFGNASGYAIFHSANGGANGNKINNFEIRNSTCYNFTKGLLYNSMSNSASVLVESCTFNDMVGSNNYFMDFGTAYTVSSLNVNNSIFGKTKDAALSNGIRASTSTSIVTNNCYTTSDFFFIAKYTLPGLNLFSGLSTELYTDPANGVFTFKATSFPGKTSSGDPRWR
jgi:hypothetical protein